MNRDADNDPIANAEERIAEEEDSNARQTAGGPEDFERDDTLEQEREDESED